MGQLEKSTCGSCVRYYFVNAKVLQLDNYTVVLQKYYLVPKKKKAHKYFGAKKHDVQELFSKDCVKKCINIKNGSDKVNVGKVRDY